MPNTTSDCSVSRDAAVQILEGETAHQTVERIMRTAETLKVRFASLELRSILVLGRMKLVRFRTSSPIQTVLESLAETRAVVYQDGGKFVIRVPHAGPKSEVNTLTMTCVAEPALKRTYRGVGVKFWERQFG